MRLRFLDGVFCVCKLSGVSGLDLGGAPCFLACTGEETSFVCPERSAPVDAVRVEGGWRCFSICGALDFSQVGVMAGIGGVLAGVGVSLLALSTFDTDYFLIRCESEGVARRALVEAGYEF